MSRIEICGNIASGKTTLCSNLNSGKIAVFENFKENPFYIDFYSDPITYSFETEITFLLQHYHSIKRVKEDLLLVCDFSLLLDIAYADVNLSGERHRIFLEIVDELQKEIGHPSKIIFLTCPVEMLLQRIISRNREVETSITVDYLRAIEKAVLFRIREISIKVPIVTIDSNTIDFRTGIEGIVELKQFN